MSNIIYFLFFHQILLKTALNQLVMITMIGFNQKEHFSTRIIRYKHIQLHQYVEHQNIHKNEEY